MMLGAELVRQEGSRVRLVFDPTTDGGGSFQCVSGEEARWATEAVQTMLSLALRRAAGQRPDHLMTFRRYVEDDGGYRGDVHINPAFVKSVEESERRPAFRGYWQVAVITMDDGKEIVVEDGARTAAKRVREAMGSKQP